PLPGVGLKEFRLDMPAFERFDVVAARWDGEGLDDVDVKVVECKLEPGAAIPQARTYQLCVPSVYIASNRELDGQLAKKLDRYGIGYIEVSKGSARVVLEARRSSLFSVNFYRSEVLPRVVTLLLFYDFVTKLLGMPRSEVPRKADYSLKRDYLWISHVKASEDVQWSMVYDAGRGIMRLGLNVESTNVVRKCFHGRSLEEVRQFFEWLRDFLPRNFILTFENRCPECPRVKFKPGMQHGPFKELGWRSKPLLDLSNGELDFIAEKILSYEYVEFGVWAIILTLSELPSWTRSALLKQVKHYKERYLDEVYRKLQKQIF
ncbi:MAG: hypothetical protein J7K82_04670, partial [Thermoproteales archaeon]|nr:hypothetical protein [Thermoproteales archaeon]